MCYNPRQSATRVRDYCYDQETLNQQPNKQTGNKHPQKLQRRFLRELSPLTPQARQREQAQKGQTTAPA
jgi:hypothetical protein